jgi:hypothetical protein
MKRGKRLWGKGDRGKAIGERNKKTKILKTRR